MLFLSSTRSCILGTEGSVMSILFFLCSFHRYDSISAFTLTKSRFWTVRMWSWIAGHLRHSKGETISWAVNECLLTLGARRLRFFLCQTVGLSCGCGFDSLPLLTFFCNYWFWYRVQQLCISRTSMLRSWEPWQYQMLWLTLSMRSLEPRGMMEFYQHQGHWAVAFTIMLGTGGMSMSCCRWQLMSITPVRMDTTLFSWRRQCILCRPFRSFTASSRRCASDINKSFPSLFFWSSTFECAKRLRMLHCFLIISGPVLLPTSKLASGTLQCLRSPDGVLFVAGKKHYFGVGGGTRQFKTLIDEDGTFCSLHRFLSLLISYGSFIRMLRQIITESSNSVTRSLLLF